MIRIFIADDHPIVREGLKRLVTELNDLTVVGEAASGEEVLAAVRKTEVDVVLLDVSMPGPGVLELIRQLKELRAEPRILVLSMHPEELYAVRVLRAGAAGYLMKNHTPGELAAAIRLVHRGNRYVSPSLAERLLLDLEPGAAPPPHEKLSDREYQVLCLLGQGKAGKEIAAQLSLSPKTVSTYRSRILQKLELETTADLIRYFVEHELSL